MISHLTHHNHKILFIFSRTKSFKPKHSFFYSTKFHKGNYYLSTLSKSTTTQKIQSSFIPFILPSISYIIKRSIVSLDTQKEIEQAERWLKKFTKEKIPRGKRLNLI